MYVIIQQSSKTAEVVQHHHRLPAVNIFGVDMDLPVNFMFVHSYKKKKKTSQTFFLFLVRSFVGREINAVQL